MAKRTFKNTTTPLSVFARNGNNGWIESAKENQHFNTYDDYIAAVANDKGYSDSEKAYVYNDNFVKDVTKGEKPQGDQAYVNYSHNHNDRTLKGDTKKGTDYDDSELAKKIDTYGINDTTVTSKDVNKFFKDSQSFFEKQQEKAGSTSWENASENYSQFDKKYNKLKKKAYDVSHFLSQNKDNMKEKDYQEAIDYIHSVRKNGKALADAYKSAETYYSQFDSAKEARKAEMGWGANTSESNMTKDKIAKRQDYYNQTQSAIRELDAKIAQKEQIVNASQNNKSATYGMYNSDNNLPSYSMYNPDVSASMALRDLATLKAERDNLLRESQTYERNQKQFDDNQTILNSKEYQKSLKSYNIDSSNDKLNTYLRNKNHIGSALENQRNGIASSEDLALIEGNQSGWDMLTESEIQTYNSILSAQGDDAAYKWLDDMKNIIDQRITQSVVDDYSKGSGLEKVITNLGTVPMSVAGGIGSAVSDAYNLAKGNDITPYDSMHFAQNLTSGIRSETSEEIDKLTGGAKAPISGMTLGGAYQAVMSGIDSLAGASMFGMGYTGLMSMGAFSSTAKDLYERGASNEQIAWGSMLAGAAEYVFERVSIENFLNTTDTRSKLEILKQILKQGGVEASEEFATELANIVSDYAVMGDGSNFSEWISDGGLKHAFAQAGLQAIEAAEGGFLSGAGMAGLGSTGNYHSYNSQMTQAGKDFFPTAYGLLDSETGFEGLDTARASKAMESIKSGKNSSKNFRELGKLVNSAEEILREKATKESIKAQLSVERNQRGDETEVTDSEVDKVYKQLNNNAEWSRSDKLTKQRVEQFKSERTGEVNRKVQEGLSDIASKSAEKIAKDETVESVASSIADKVNEESGHNIEEVLSTSRVDNKTVLNMKDDNGNTVKSGEIEYANRKQAVMIETLAKMEVSAKTANDIIQYMNALPSDLSEQDFSKEMLGIREAYIYGRYGQKYETIESKGFLNDVSDNTRKMFYNRGSVDSMERYSGNKKQYVKSYGGVKFVGNLENNQGKLTAEQNYQIGAVRNIAKHITKNNIVFYESVVNENGERVLDVDLPFRAKGKTAPNGAFTANDGTIYLDVNAGENGEALIMHTFSHEVTHFAAEYSDKFEKLKNFVVNEIVGSGQDFNDLVNRKIMQSADEDGNPTLNFSTAQEEVIADAMQSMLTNTDAMEKMYALKNIDYDTFGKIKEIFTKLYNKIKELYKNVNPQTYEGRMILEMKESLDKISDLFAEAVVDAGNKYEILAEEVSNEEAFMDSNIAVLNQIRTPYNEGTKAWKEYVDGLNPEAKKVHDIFYNFYTLSKLTNTTNINGKRVKKLNISSVFMTAQTWNQKISEDSQWADAAVKLAESLPDNIRKNMRMNKDGSLEYSELEQKLKMSKSLAQRLVDALGYEKIDNVYDIDGKKVTLSTNGATQSVGGEAYRRALIAETRKLYKEGKLRKVKINTMSKDRWGSLGFLAANGKTTASGDFTTICPQMMFNYGCFYCYRRAALETGVNNKLVAESVWYTGEILRIKDSDVKTLNENGGLRIQSFGDWMPHFSAQLADVLYDAETRGLQVKIITKEPSMIEYVARLRDQGIGKNLYFNISADYVIEAIEGNADNQSGTSLVQPNPARPFMRKDGKYWWKRALSVEEAAGYRAKYPWVNVRIVATDVEEFIRGLKDPNVQVVTGYHGTIRNEKRFDSENGQFKMTVEPIGDAGMPRFNFSNGEWNIEYEGKTKHHKKLANAIEDNNLQQDYYNKSCCITGRCATCLGKCGKVADSFYTKNATNADTESVEYWKEHMTVAEMDESESIEVDMKKSLNQIHRLSDRYFETPTLKTLKGSKIQRSSKYGIGKQMGSQIYVHKNYASEIIPEDVWHEAQRLIEGEFDYNCVMYDTKNPNIVRFDESPDFDTSREPKPGKMMKVDVSTGEIEPAKGNGNMIWHHKWQWVKNDYTGFDVQDSYNWSKEWLQKISNPSGSLRVWNNTLRDNGLPVDSEDNTKYSLRTVETIKPKTDKWQIGHSSGAVAVATKNSVLYEGQPMYSDRVLFGSYFSGGGTFEAGLEYKILQSEFAVENNAKIAAVWEENHGKDKMFVGDVRDFTKKVKDLFYFHASPSCTNHSRSNHKRGETETDILTAKATSDAIRRNLPAVVTIENVKQYKGTVAYNIITSTLDELGYTWDANVYKASDFGNPTKRERLIIRAVERGLELPSVPAKNSEVVSWGEATKDLWGNLKEYHLNESTIKAIKNTPGLKDIDLSKQDRALLIYGTNNGGRVDYAWEDGLCPTLTTKCGDARIIINGKIYQPTPQFMGRLQGLPDDYEYNDKKSTAYRIIGNGIPVQLTKSVMGDLLESAYSQKNNGKALYSERDANMKDMQDKVNEFLVEENKKLKADIENLREVIRMQENVIDDRKVTNSSIRKAGSKILENAGIDRGSKEFYDMLTDLYKYIADDGNELLESKAEAIADWVIEHRSKKKTTTISEESSEVLDHLKGKRLRVTEEQKKEIESAYGSYNNFRKMLLGTVTITTKEDAPTIESEWQELAELFPAHFNADDNSQDMPEKLLRTVDSLKASKDIEEYVFASEFDKQDIIIDIYGEYWKAATLRSPASKYQKEVNELKAAHAINMQNIRLEHKLEVKRLKDDFRKQFKNAREYYRQKSDEVIQRIRDRQDAMTEKRRTTDVRNKVKRLYKELKDSPWKTKGVTYPEGLVRSVIDICELIDPTGEDQSTKTAKEHWDSMRALQNLRMEYDRMEQAGYEFASEHDKYMSWYIDELSKRVGEKPLRDMNLNEITSVYNVLEEINIALRFATKLLDREEGRSVLDAWEGVIENQKEVQMKGLNKSLKGTQWFNDLIRQWTLNPMRAAYEMTGYDENAELYKLFKDINDGRIKQDFFIMNANKMFESLRETKEGKKLYNDAVEKTIDFGIKDVTGKTVRLSKMQAMQAIMTYERATTNEHQKHLDSPVRFVRVEDAVKGNMGDAFVNGYDVMLTDYVVNKLKNKLESWDKEYMDQAHKLFNEVAKNAINETTLKTKRRIIATDKNYIPYMVNENELNKESEHGNFKASIESSGMLQRLIRDTDTQLVMTGLNDILDEHIKGVGKIYGLSIPVRNWNKIMNLRVKRNSGQKRTTAKDMIANTWHGQKAWKLLSDAVADMQSPRPNNTPVAIQALKSAFVTSTLASNISVTMKQFASYPTAGAVLSGTSLMRASYAFGISGNAMKELWKEIDTYTPQHYFRRLGLSVQELGEMSQSNGWQNKLNNRLGMLSPMNWIQAFDVRTTQALWVASKFDAGKKYAKGTKEYYEYAAELYNKTLEETQPMYDALHRAEVTKNSSMQNFVMFMTQPLQNSGILHEATHGLKANIKKHGANSKQAKEAGEKFRKAVVSQCASHLLFTLMTFAGGVMLHRVNPWRDDDKELTWESFISEYGKEFLENYANAILPFANYVFSGIEKVMGKSSYDVFSAPVIDKINGTLDIMNKQYKSVYDQESGEFVDLTDKSNMSKFFDTSLNTVAEVLSYFGIPGANIKKIADSVKLYKQDIENGDLWKFEAGVDRNKSEKLNRIYRFITEGDKESLDKEVKTFKDESAYMSALVESLVNNDDRVTKAAELRDSGKMSDYKKLVKQIVKEGNFTQDEVVKGVNKVINQMHKDDDDGSSGSSKPVAMFNTSDIANAITGDTSELKTIKKELVSEKVAKGKDKEDARKEVISSIKTKADSLLQSDDIKNSTYKKVLTKYCGKSEEDAELLSKYTKYKGKNPDTEMSTTAYGNYLSIVKDTGLSATEYDAYYGDFKDIKGEDKNGDGKTDAYSTMDNQIAYIDSLDLTPAQKTAFFLATGTKGERSKAAMKRIKW